MVRWSRLLRHAFTLPMKVRTLFPPAALERVRDAIAAVEQKTSGEVRVAVEASLPWSYLWRDAPVRQRAVMVFSKLRVWDTEHNNGVLIYLEVADRGVEIVADRGIARHVTQEQWDAIARQMRERLRAGDAGGAVAEAVTAVGELLALHHPLAAGDRNPNELSDKPVLL